MRIQILEQNRRVTSSKVGFKHLYNIRNSCVFCLFLVTMLYITSPGLIYFTTGSLYLLTTFIHFAHLLPLETTNQFSVSMSLVFCLGSMYK